MYVCDKLKLNKFQLCAIPSPKDYFSRFGFTQACSGLYTGDDPASMPSSKLDSLRDAQRFDDYQMYAEQQQQQQQQPSE